MTTAIHYDIRVKGRVQGVFFRAETRKKALQLGLRGWVKNEADGNVRIVVEGTHQCLEPFIAWCRKGPRLAHVSELTMSRNEVIGYSDFEIRR